MKIGVSIIILLCAVCMHSVHAQVADTLLWQPERTLNWMDYKGVPDQQSHYTALTHAEIRYQVSMQRSFAKFDFATLFLKKTSWTKHTRDPLLLKHEQVHFNIAELHKRVFIEILYTRHLSYTGFETEVKRLGDSVNVARHRMDDAFDADVSNMRDNMKINKWYRQIEEMLNRLKAYDRNSILIALK